MAALTEPVPVSVEPTLCAIESGREDDTIIVSSKRLFINTLKLSDQKLVSSLPVRVGIDITSPAVWNETKEEYYLVQNKKEVLIWKEGQANLEKAKKRQIATAVHKLFSIPSFEPVVLNENGTVSFFSESIKGNIPKGLLLEGEQITWCSSVKLQGGICVLFTSCAKAKVKEDLTLHCHWYSVQDDLWKHTATPLESHGELLSCACCNGASQNEVRLFALWSDGSLHEMVLSDTTATERGQPISLKGLSSPCSLFCLSDNDFAVVGLKKNNQKGVAILDQKFGNIRAWQPFPLKGKFEKAFCQREHILVHFGKMLYMYRFECQASTLASMIGHQRGMPTEKETSCQQRLPREKRTSSDSEKTQAGNEVIVKALTNLSDPSKTSSYTAFKREFAQLKTQLKEPDVWVYLGGLSSVLNRCCSEKKFWPAEELEFLLSKHCVSSCDVVTLFKAVLAKKDVGLMYKALISQSGDLPETCLCFAMQCFLSSTDEDVATAVASLATDPSKTTTREESTNTLDDAMPCPFSKGKAFLIDRILDCPFDETYLLSSTRKLPFDLVVILLRYILYALKTPRTASDLTPEQYNERLNQLSRWEAVVLDAHASQLIMAKDTHELVIKFSEEEDTHVSYITEAHRELFEKLKHMMTKTADQQKKAIGQYCIEVLHLY